MLKPEFETELKPNRFLQVHNHDDRFFVSLKNKETNESLTLYDTSDWSNACNYFDSLAKAIRNCFL